MKDFEKLELSVETLRELTDDQMTQVAGGASPTTGTSPSYGGGTWTMACQHLTITDWIQTG